ncbi:MAG: helix-turn-helix domain-containing protein [Chloroflexia bacterium]
MNRLKQVRERKSFTLAQLSARTGIAVRVLESYEANLEEISPNHLKVLSKVLWVKPGELVPPPSVEAPPAEAGAASTAAYQPAAAQGDATTAQAPQAVAQTPGSVAPRPYQPPAPYGGPPAGDRPPRQPMNDGGRPPRPGPSRREPVIMPATDGQITEVMRLAARLNRSTAEIETEFGRGMAEITRFDAREWIKKLREDALAQAPPAKVHFGQWPGLKDDREAVYLAEQRELGSAFRVALFNGQAFEGRIVDFTPYTLTLEHDTPRGAEQIVLRKLAVAYYHRISPGDGTAPTTAKPFAEPKDIAPFPGSGAPEFAAPEAASPTAAEAPAAETAPAPKPRAPRKTKKAAAAEAAAKSPEDAK